MISTESLRIDYDDVNAVQDLDLKISTGQIFGLVGPNGAGKTSTIKAISGIIEPTYGEIKIGGYDLEVDTTKALQILGYMPDFPPVYENLKVWEYLDVFAAAYLLPASERKKRSKIWIEKVSLTDKWDSYIRDLSRGMRQRLVLAKTLLPDPQVLILDEPASGLDPIARREMRDVLKSVAKEDKTILISSHILSELSDFCNAVGIMERGRMVVSGSMSEIRSQIGTKDKLVIQLSQKSEKFSQKVANFLNNYKNAENIQEHSPDHIECEFNADSDEAAWVLTQLVNLEIPICSYHMQKADVEDIFFKIGATEVS